MCLPNILVKNKWISEFRRTNHQELKCWSTFCVIYFLRYNWMMQHQPIVKRVNGTHEWAHRPYQLLITAACTNTGGKMKGSHSRAADRCPFVLGHSLSQVTSFMHLGMLCVDYSVVCWTDPLSRRIQWVKKKGQEDPVWSEGTISAIGSCNWDI